MAKPTEYGFDFEVNADLGMFICLALRKNSL